MNADAPLFPVQASTMAERVDALYLALIGVSALRGEAVVGRAIGPFTALAFLAKNGLWIVAPEIHAGNLVGLFHVRVLGRLSTGRLELHAVDNGIDMNPPVVREDS